MSLLCQKCWGCGRKGPFRLDKLFKLKNLRVACRNCGAEYFFAIFSSIIFSLCGTILGLPIMVAFFLPSFETIGIAVLGIVLTIIIILFYPIVRFRVPVTPYLSMRKHSTSRRLPTLRRCMAAWGVGAETWATCPMPDHVYRITVQRKHWPDGG